MSDLIFELDGIAGGRQSDSDDNGGDISPIRPAILSPRPQEVIVEERGVEDIDEGKPTEDLLSLAQQLERLRSLATPSPLPTPTFGRRKEASPHRKDGAQRLLKQQAFLAETDREIKTQQTLTLAPSASTPFIYGEEESPSSAVDEVEEPSKPEDDRIPPPILHRQALKVSTRDFQLMRVIGKGAYGKVFLVRKVSGKDHEQLYAMKVLRKATLTVRKKDAEHTQSERNILEAIQHPMLVRLYYAFQTDHKLYLILEYAQGGELYSYLAKESLLKEDTVIFYMAEIVLAIEHLHSLGIIYRDLKPENILLDKGGHVILTDFGLSKVSLDDEKTNTVCGTVEYMAPEILAHTPYNRTCDYWSMGTLLFDMLSGAPPFTGGNRKKTIEKILNAKVSTKIQQCRFLTPNAKDILGKLLRRDPSVRLSEMSTLKQHRFFKSVDWQKCLAKTWRTPPYEPVMQTEDDTSHFDKQFTEMPVIDTPLTSSPERSVRGLRSPANELATVADESGQESSSSQKEGSASAAQAIPLDGKAELEKMRDIFKGFSFVNDTLLSML